MAGMRVNKIHLALLFLGLGLCCPFSLAIAREDDSKYALLGAYSVPVPSALYEFAQFEIAQVKVVVRGEIVKIQYDLPVELTGVSNEFEFTGALSGEWLILSSIHGKMICNNFLADVDKTIYVNCEAEYKDLLIDLQLRDEKLEQISKDTKELSNRKSVAQLFSTRPIGVLSFSFRK